MTDYQKQYHEEFLALKALWKRIFQSTRLDSKVKADIPPLTPDSEQYQQILSSAFHCYSCYESDSDKDVGVAIHSNGELSVLVSTDEERDPYWILTDEKKGYSFYYDTYLGHHTLTTHCIKCRNRMFYGTDVWGFCATCYAEATKK